mgnify:CR=1 FL=1
MLLGCHGLTMLTLAGNEHETRMSVENDSTATRVKGPPISLMTVEELYDLVLYVTSGYEIELLIVLGAVKDWVENQPGNVGKAAILNPVNLCHSSMNRRATLTVFVCRALELTRLTWKRGSGSPKATTTH